ncbi:MAG: hypothetical protein JJT75_02040 [Opitutales bacterium]|nr:hypothetical protein [Opitutales bacterium]
MYNYNDKLKKFELEKVSIREKEGIRAMLRSNRKTNQDRLRNNLPEKLIKDFQKQGSYAHRTMIQNDDNDYDIDDGVIFRKEDLLTPQGNEMTTLQVRDMIAEALQDDKFEKKPERMKNCVRVFYKAGHHVDIPAFRIYENQFGHHKCEIASSDWRESDPKKINNWFDERVASYKKDRDEKGSQFRRMIRLLKRFCRSRPTWTMPSGLILTMLTDELMPDYDRDDECFYYLLKKINERLKYSGLRVYNRSDESISGKEELTKSDDDACMRNFRDRSGEAIEKLNVLHESDCTAKKAGKAWDWVFKSDGFFDEDGDDSNNGDDGSPDNFFGIARSTPKKAVDAQGGGRFG